jgi:hypothetical protein
LTPRRYLNCPTCAEEGTLASRKHMQKINLHVSSYKRKWKKILKIKNKNVPDSYRLTV